MAPAPCGVCGEPTKGKYGVCANTGECRQEYQRRWQAEHQDSRRDAMRHYNANRPHRVRRPEYPCAVCGQLTASSQGVCGRTAACKAEYRRRYRHEESGTGPVMSCEICGEPTSAPCGVCGRRDSPECAREYQRRYAAAPAGSFSKRHVLCAVCGRDTTSECGVCDRAPECRRERYRRLNPEISRASAPCDVCGARTRSALGVCQGTPECRREDARRRRLPGQRELRPCDVCGVPCSGRYGVCRRTPDCIREYQRRRDAVVGQPPLPTTPCQVCGQPTRGKYGACNRTVACRTELKRQWRKDHPDEHRKENRRYWLAKTAEVRASRPKCEVCGAPTVAASGICTRTSQCRDAARARKHHPKGPAAPCEVCGMPTTAPCRVCSRTPACRAGYQRKKREAELPPCLGCGTPTGAESGRCPPCRARYRRNADKPWKNRRPPWWNSREARCLKVRELTARQQGACAWCRKPLPADPDAAEIDHVIPQAVLWRLFGFTIHADWNLQALHPPCNQAKGESATAEAVRVAAVHGLDLGAWGSWLAQDGLWDTA